jgi:pyruvate kinase
MPHIRRNRQSKIIATLGPASSDKDMICTLFEAGVDVFRLNFSHGRHDEHRARVEAIRTVEREFSHPIGMIGDLQGPKLRIGAFADGGIDLAPGRKLRLDLDDTPGDASRVQLPHPEVISALEKGADILLDDGKVKLVVRDKQNDALETEVVSGHYLSDHKGVNVPGVILPIPALTDKDKRDLKAALDMGVDWIAQSFVQRPADLAEARKLIDGRAGLIMKLEKPAALEHLEELIDMADAVMLARGDLGVEIPPEDVPAVQKHVLRRVRQKGKPGIVATQMLESMTESPTPTRAEASDVATAVYDGTDAVMLSAETAAGQYPREAVAIMDRIAGHVEDDRSYERIINAEHPEAGAEPSDAITVAAYHVAKNIDAAAIVNFTSSGSTALRTARQRPDVPILCLTQNMDVAHRLTLSYGVHPVHVEGVENTTQALEVAGEKALEQGIAEKGQRIVLTAGVPFNTPGSTNVLRIAWVA